jgi:hypothetical protein
VRRDGLGVPDLSFSAVVVEQFRWAPLFDVASEAAVHAQPEGQVVANGATIKLDPEGNICVYTSRQLDLAVDVTGYYPA